MCGIIGIIGKHPVSGLLVDGLKRLEYRGYDSAGIATVDARGFTRVRAEGKLVNLAEALTKQDAPGTVGIGHTRWATHGVPNETNAHPHMTDKVAVVHNGIIENYRELREELQRNGFSFASQTDTEVVPNLITHYLKDGLAPADAVSMTLKRLHGAFALAIIFRDDPNVVIVARRGSPLAIGYGDGEMYIGSDAIALAPFTSKITYLEEGDWAEVRRDSVVIHDSEDRIVARDVKATALTGAAIGKGNYRHYMQKEIHEQPAVIGDTLYSYYHRDSGDIRLPQAPFALDDISKITLVACGTSYYACMTARYWLESLTRLPVELDIASEFRYRDPVLPDKGLAIFVSQSGETADTLAALRLAKASGQRCLAIVNAPESSMAQEAHWALTTHAGPEIGVASTKAFTTQLVTLACLAIGLADARGKLDAKEKARLAQAMAEVPERAAELLNHEDQIAAIAGSLMNARDILYMGRGTSYAIAMEGALKLKEISYIHAEGYAAGELKHGPIALIDEQTPVIVIAPSDGWFEKTASNMQEVLARGGKVVLLSDEKGLASLGDTATATIKLPAVDPFVAPMLYAIPIQLIAYHVAVLKGTDVDQPRNLAKSVTVE